jgi:glycerol-3-phosphate O-acyltransferase
VVLLTLALAVVVVLWLARRWADRATVRVVHRFGARVNRFKLTRKGYIRDTLLANGAVAEAAERHAHEQGTADEEAWRLVRQYIDEIVPFFNILAYYKFGYAASRATLNMLYKVSVDYQALDELDQLPRDAVVL